MFGLCGPVRVGAGLLVTNWSRPEGENETSGAYLSTHLSTESVGESSRDSQQLHPTKSNQTLKNPAASSVRFGCFRQQLTDSKRTVQSRGAVQNGTLSLRFSFVDAASVCCVCRVHLPCPRGHGAFLRRAVSFLRGIGATLAKDSLDRCAVDGREVVRSLRVRKGR